ncbi:MAG: hypothetical protein AAF915_11660 [Cyanobacteria bacterium P01_D01_bin.50]
MKTLRLIKFVPIVLAICLIFTYVQLVQAEVVLIERDFQPDPLTLSGESGGLEKSNCGNIGAKPNHVIEVTESLPYLLLTVKSKGKPTLLIDGPEGRFCVLGDSYSQNKPEISGFWQAGNYSLYIGELSKQQHSYTLSISQQKITQK